MFPFFRDYRIDDSDPGEFLDSADIEIGAELSSECTSSGSIYTFDRKADNPKPQLRYFCSVGGGYRGFRLMRNAANFLNQPD